MDNAPYFKTVASSEDEGELSGSDDGIKPKTNPAETIRGKYEYCMKSLEIWSALIFLTIKNLNF